MRGWRLILAAGILGADAAGQRVLVVDSGGGGQFVAIQGAIDAAADGDTVLVKPGTYFGFRVSDKSLVIVADAPGRIVLRPPVATVIAIDGLAAGQAVVIRNFAARGGLGVIPRGGAALSVIGCAGPVTIEDCELAAYSNPVNSGAYVSTSRAVTMVRCEVSAAAMQCTSYGCVPALLATAATVHLHDCRIVPTTSLCAAGQGCTGA